MGTAGVVQFETLDMAEQRIVRNCSRRVAASASARDRVENKLLASIILGDVAETSRLERSLEKMNATGIRSV